MYCRGRSRLLVFQVMVWFIKSYCTHNMAMNWWGNTSDPLTLFQKVHVCTVYFCILNHVSFVLVCQTFRFMSLNLNNGGYCHCSPFILVYFVREFKTGSPKTGMQRQNHPTPHADFPAGLVHFHSFQPKLHLYPSSPTCIPTPPFHSYLLASYLQIPFYWDLSRLLSLFI